MTSWEKFSEEKFKLLSRGQNILDIGGGGIPLQKHLLKYKELFAHIQYVVVDKDPKSPEVVKGDAHHLPFADESFDAVICKSVLEHVEDPVKVVSEMKRVLRPGGYGIVYVPFLFPYHAAPGKYADYWRFTSDGIRYLFRDFSKVEMANVRGIFETTVHLVPIARTILKYPARLLDYFSPSKNQTSGFTIFVKK